MKIYHSMAIASVVSVAAIAFSLTPTATGEDTPSSTSNDEYAAILPQTCSICDGRGAVTVLSDSVEVSYQCAACRGYGKITTYPEY